MASEVITSIVENLPINTLIDPPRRITLPDCPAPSSEVHEKDYYPNEGNIIKFINDEYHFWILYTEPFIFNKLNFPWIDNIF